MIRLSDKWATYLVNQPETGMDYCVASVILKNGTRYNQVLIVHCTLLTQIRTYFEIPFREEDIAEIIVTHDKWDWSKKD